MNLAIATATNRLRIVVAFALICGVSSRAIAQMDPSRVEAWAAVSGVTASSNGTLVSSYSPPLLLDGNFTSSAGQSVSISAQWTAGFSAGFNVFPWRHGGLQFLIDRVTDDVTGTSDPYAFTLRYISRQPPNSEPQNVTVGRSEVWPNITGAVTHLTFAFNAVVRVGKTRRITATMSAGPALTRVSGEIQPLGFTTFHLGGHSVLFEDDYRLGGSVGPAVVLGVNAGGDVSIAAGHHVALLIGFRYFRTAATDTPVSAVTILNPTEITFTQSLNEVSAAFGTPPVHMSTSGARVLFGVKVSP